MRVAIVGATGVLGRHLLPRLVERGHAVRALARTAAARERLGRLGIETVPGDILDAASLAPAVAGCAAALHLATAIPPPGPRADWRMNDRIRREGTANLLAACAAGGVGRYLQQSIAMIHCGADDRPQTEDDPVTGTGALASALDMEAAVRATALDWRILRGALFYGPGTGRDNAWRQAAREGTLACPGDGAAFLSLIHVADMAAAVVAVLEADAPRSVWIAADDAPVRYRDLYAHLAALEDAPAPSTGAPAGLPSFRVSNARLRHELGWRPRYPSYRSGLAR